MRWTSTLLTAAVVSCLPATVARTADDAAVRVQLASGQKALMPIVVGQTASERTRAAAGSLAEYLSRIAEARFEVVEGDGASGIAVGLPKDFPDRPFSARWAAPEPAEREDYLLRSHAGGVYLVGATELAVEHAVWDFLDRIGYRQFFPGERWEVVPAVPELSVALSVQESPDYYARRIWYGFGGWDYNQEPYLAWCARNRATSGVELRTGHSYGGIISGLKAQFEKHPEFYALVGGRRDVRGQAKLCIGNPELRRLVAEHAVAQFDRDPAADSISMDPSDGGGWCECDRCAALGSVSDRALTLANEAASAVAEKYPGKLVGMYAYAHHSPPPGIEPHPAVVVSVATAFLKGGLTLDEIIEGWSRQGATLGIREYYSVNTWDRDMPAKSRGSNLEYLRQTIPDFHARGARFMSAESSDNWGPNGPGYYLAARMLWDTDEAENVDALVDDFLRRTFGPAEEPMREFYAQLEGSRQHLVFADQLGRMFRSLDRAGKLADSPEIRGRIDDLIQYARYVDLYHRYATSKGTDRQAAFERLIRHAYRMRTTMLVHTKALYRDLASRDKSVSIPPGAEWNVPEPDNPWKSSEPFRRDELAGFLAEGIDRYPLTSLDFTPVAFKGDLVPADALDLPDAEPGELSAGRGEQTFSTYVAKAPATIELGITGGLIEHYRDRGNVRVELWKIGGTSRTGQRETLVVSDRSVPPDGVRRTVMLRADETGLYKIVVHDGNDRTRLDWSAGLPMTIVSSLDAPMSTSYSGWTLYFYVPKGTTTLGLYGGGRGEIQDAAGRTILSLNDRSPGFYSADVPEGQGGRLWRIRGARGSIRLMTVPPCLARSGSELLLPREVVERDAAAD